MAVDADAHTYDHIILHSEIDSEVLWLLKGTIATLMMSR